MACSVGQAWRLFCCHLAYYHNCTVLIPIIIANCYSFLFYVAYCLLFFTITSFCTTVAVKSSNLTAMPIQVLQ
uniref:Putative ovule protein n=1 Tax=Solanum chacoense TaxID=4108 RepID=A0A0V0GRG6_SOLCH